MGIMAKVSGVMLALRDHPNDFARVMLVNPCLSGLAVVALYWGRRRRWQNDNL